MGKCRSGEELAGYSGTPLPRKLGIRDDSAVLVDGAPPGFSIASEGTAPKSSGVVSDLDENVIRDYALAHGRVDVKVCAVDEVWSGLKHVIRKEDR
jgi:hypothetical protein